jgi:hypothetical protein
LNRSESRWTQIKNTDQDFPKNLSVFLRYLCFLLFKNLKSRRPVVPSSRRPGSASLRVPPRPSAAFAPPRFTLIPAPHSPVGRLRPGPPTSPSPAGGCLFNFFRISFAPPCGGKVGPASRRPLPSAAGGSSIRIPPPAFGLRASPRLPLSFAFPSRRPVIAATPPSIFLFCTSQRPAFQPSLFTQERPPALADRRPSCYRDAALLDPSFDGQIKLFASSFKLLESRPESGWARLAPDRCRSVSLRVIEARSARTCQECLTTSSSSRPSPPVGRIRPGPPTSPSAAGGSFIQNPRKPENTDTAPPLSRPEPTRRPGSAPPLLPSRPCG